MTRIDADSVTLSVTGESEEPELRLPNNCVLVFVGGEPPYPLLKDIGVAFGDDVGGATPPTPSSVTVSAQ